MSNGCPCCHDTDVVLKKVNEIYICPIDDYVKKIKNTDEYYINLIENLKEEIKLRDLYIQKVLGVVKKKLIPR